MAMTTPREEFESDPLNPEKNRRYIEWVKSLSGQEAKAELEKLEARQRVVEARNMLARPQPLMEQSQSFGAQHGLYLTASGTLMQLNAIVAAIFGAVLPSAETSSIKSLFTIALLLHVVAAVTLCWAARPTSAEVGDHTQTVDTFRNYRRGWRMTLLALLTSAVAAGFFVLGSLGVTIPFDRFGF